MSTDSSPSSPKKDVIYVDIEDDITSIIDKVKEAKASIVALVPPKRIGVLQSVVNLKLLQRAASNADRRVVLITSDPALVSLAAGVAIPVAKNLQTKPEVPEAKPADTEVDEIINGDELPVGELAAAAGVTATAGAPAVAGKPEPTTKPLAASAAANAPRKKSKLPDFDTFRKKLFIGIGAGVALIIFLVWAIIFAPHATVAITAQTNLINIDQTLQLKPNVAANMAQNLLPVTVKQTKKTASVDFDATGKKDVGDKATGTVNVRNCDSSQSFIIPSGTTFTASSGQTFTNNAAVTVSGFSGSASACRITGAGAGTGAASVTATASGPDYNIAATSYKISGVDGDVYANGSAMSGGSTKLVTVVSQDDIDKAKQQLQAQDANAVKTELKKQFGSDMIVIDESFKAEAGQPASSPAVDQEATKAKLTVETTYTLVGIVRSDLRANFDAYLKKQLAGKEDQKVYDSGDGSASFTQFTAVDGGYTAKVSTQAQVGPQINESSLKSQLVGKRAGEIQQQLSTVEGVEDVETSFSPFWVTTAPGADKITIKFVLKNNGN